MALKCRGPGSPLNFGLEEYEELLPMLPNLSKVCCSQLPCGMQTSCNYMPQQATSHRELFCLHFAAGEAQLQCVAMIMTGSLELLSAQHFPLFSDMPSLTRLK